MRQREISLCTGFAPQISRASFSDHPLNVARLAAASTCPPVQLREELVVKDVPEYLARVDAYIAQIEHSEELQRAHAPLTYGPLLEVDRRRLEASLPTATGTFCPPGLGIDRFPTPPVANSPFGVANDGLPYPPPLSAPPAIDPRDVAPAQRSSEEFLPPVTGQTSQRALPVRRVGNPSGGLAIRQAGWQRSRSTR